MENDSLTAAKSHITCQSWVGQNGWSTTSSQGTLFNHLPSSQHLSLGSSSHQRPSCDRLQASNRSCMIDISIQSSTNHSGLYKASHICSNPSSTPLFSNTAIPSSSHSISFAQQSPHISTLLLTVNQGKIINPPSLSKTNQALPANAPQQLPLLSSHDSYKASFHPPLTNQSLSNGLQVLPISLPSCGLHGSTSEPTFERTNVEFIGVSGYTHNRGSSTSQEYRQWIPSSHCSEAVDVSVRDAAAHANKETSLKLQEGNISQLVNSQRWRSELLHQRAQLLQQLAELDKLIESIPPDVSNDGQSPHTADEWFGSSQWGQNKTADTQLSAEKSKSQSPPMVNCSSPATKDEESDSHDAPEDPLSAAELEKKGNASDESEDISDPDYIPNSDSDLSDFLSDADSVSSDEPPTPTDERSSLPERKRLKMENSSFKDISVSPTKQKCAINRRMFSETVVLPCSNSKEQRVYDKRNYCVFCSKPMSKMARHLETVHSDKTEVAAAFQYPKNSKERQKIWNRLTNQGNFVHNKIVLKTGKGQLAVRKRPTHMGQARDFLHCLYCRGLFVKKALHRHMRLCPEREKNGSESQIGRKRIALRCVLETSEDLGISDGFKSVLSQMTYDDVTQAVMDDPVILQFGELLINQHGSDEKKHDYIRQNLRQIARLLLEAQKITPLEKLEDFFLPSSFPHVVSAVNVLAGYSPETKTYRIPSLAIKLGYHLQKTCGIVESNAMKCGNTSLAESARNFLSVYQEKWNQVISAGALTTLKELKLSTEKKVPFAQDVKQLNFHMENVHLLAEKKLRDSPSAENYAALAKVILARTIMFNRRRAREVSLVQLTAFMSQTKSNLPAGMDISVSDLERTMCGFFTRIEIRGKCGRMVPVLLKPSILSAMELFVKLRETCGVPSKNPFLFGRPHALSAYNGSECIQKYVKACGAKDPEALKSTKIRKHYATMLQLMNLDENEADQILGPNNQVRALRQDGNMQLNDVEMNSEQRQPTSGQQLASWDHMDHPHACYGPIDVYHEQAHGGTTDAKMTVPPFVNPGKKGVQNKGKHKWEEAEVLAVERHMMHLIEGHKVPQKNDCVQCLEAEPEALRARSWKGVKDYVRNRITALKRQSRTAQATFTNSSRLGQVEPQNFQQYLTGWE